MRALDTNVVVRLLADDDPTQTAIATRAIEGGPVLLTLSVAMETEWVLRSGYGWSRARIADALTAFCALATVTSEAATGLRWAIDRLRAGADFADMIHIVAADDADTFVTFDKSIARRAGPDAPIPIETLA